MSSSLKGLAPGGSTVDDAMCAHECMCMCMYIRACVSMCADFIHTGYMSVYTCSCVFYFPCVQISTLLTS